MQQVIVRKQGRMDYDSWSSRVLTLDPAAGVLLLSKKGKPDNIAHHAMQPVCIEIWPFYDSKYVEEDFNSLPAKLTIRLAGSAFPKARSRRGGRVSRLLNSAGTDFDEAWVLRFTSLQELESAVKALERLTHLQSREVSDTSFGDGLKSDGCAVLPRSAEELLKPISKAWAADRILKGSQQDALTAL